MGDDPFLGAIFGFKGFGLHLGTCDKKLKWTLNRVEPFKKKLIKGRITCTASYL